jgi:hypothetical protein
MTSTDIDLRVAGRDSPAVARAKDILAAELAWTSNRTEIVERLSGGDPEKAKRWRQRLRTWANEPDFQQLIAQYVHGMQILDMGPIIRALTRRAEKGNIPAIKLAMESSGYYNPRVQHEHSGDISITIRNAPRPAPTEDTAIVDAEIVE